MFLYPKTPVLQQLDGFLYRMLLQWLHPAGADFPVIYSIISFILLYIQAVSFNKLVNSQRLMQKTNYLTGMCYLLITSMFSDWYSLSAPLIINTLLIAVMARLSNLHNEQQPKSSLFNSGMIIGIATFFYFPSIAFLLLVIVGLLIIRPVKLQEWVMVLIGILTPYYFLGAWVFLTDRWQDYRFPGFAVSLPKFYQTGWALAAITILLLLLVVGSFFIQSNLRRQVVQARKTWGLVFLYLLVAVFVPFLNATHSFNYWILTAVPMSAIVAAAFLYPEKKWFPLLMHWGMVAITIVMGYFLR